MNPLMAQERRVERREHEMVLLEKGTNEVELHAHFVEIIHHLCLLQLEYDLVKA